MKRKEADSFTIRPFKKLGKLIQCTQNTSSFKPEPLPAIAESDLNEEELFGIAMSDVREIAEFRRLPLRRKRITGDSEQRDPDRTALDILEEMACGSRPIDLTHTQEYVEWTNKAFRCDLSLRLHEGRFSVQEALDLHGFTVPEAEEAINLFFKDSNRKGHRCVKIIHGRGLRSRAGPVVKRAVVKLLSGRYRKQIIAYVTARQCDGGLGALYVLLAKQ